MQAEHAQQEASYRAELRRIQAEHAQEQASYHAELQRVEAERQRHERSIAELTDRLRRQLWDIRRLSRLLDDAENAAARLRSSRRWKLANPGTAIQAKLFPGKVSLGYGHLEKIVAAYSQWRASHPEIAKIEDATKGARSSILPSNAQGNSDKKVEDFPEMQSVRKIAISETSAEPE